MPTCRDMSELVTDYLERSVSLRLRLRMGWHLFLCEACRHYYDQMRRTILMLGSLSPTQPEPDAEERVLAAARGELPREP